MRKPAGVDCQRVSLAVGAALQSVGYREAPFGPRLPPAESPGERQEPWEAPSDAAPSFQESPDPTV